MITHEEALQYVYLIEEDITNVGKELKKYITQQQAKEQRAKKEHELLGLYKQLGGIECDIEYLCGLRDCVIEYSVEKPIEHIYSGIKEYKINRDDILKQIKALEEELK